MISIGSVKGRVLAAVAGAALATATLGVGIAAADPPPGGGNAFGHHVSSMAQVHAQDHGATLGQCVSTVAQGGACPHDH